MAFTAQSPRVGLGGEVFPIFIQVMPHLNTIGIDREADERTRRRRRGRHEFSRLCYVVRLQCSIRGEEGRVRDRVTKEKRSVFEYILSHKSGSIGFENLTNYELSYYFFR